LFVNSIFPNKNNNFSNNTHLIFLSKYIFVNYFL